MPADLSGIPTRFLQAVHAEHQQAADAVDNDETPSAWIGRCIPAVTLDSYQAEVVDALAERKKVSARGPRGLGKTALAALVIIWFACTREAQGKDWKIVTTSGSWYQLRNYLWPEVHKWVRKIDWAEVGVVQWRDGEQLLKTEIQLVNGAATATSPDKPDMIEGAHAESVMVLFDESKIISTEVFDAVEGIFSNVGNSAGAEGFALAVSTPGPPIGRFYDIHKRKKGLEDWYVRRVTLAECIEAGRITQEAADRLKELWGEDSAKYRNHVLGEFAADDELSLIPLSWVEQSMEAWQQASDEGFDYGTSAVRYGVDVARHGSDSTVIARRRGRIILPIETEAFTDNVSELGDQVAGEMRQSNLVTSACVDADGMGAGTADRMRTLLGDDRVTVFHGNGHDEWTDVSGELRAFNNRSAAWYNLYEWLNPARHDRLLLPPSDELIGDLTAPQLVADASGKIKLESKVQTKKRLGRSPDVGDAVVYSCWAGPAEAAPAVETVGYGDGGREAVGAYQRRRR